MKAKKILKIVGILLLLGGVTLTGIGLVDFFSSMADGERPSLFWCAFLGLPMLGIGLGFTAFAFRREISNYVMSETAPVLNNASEQLAPALRNVSKAVNNGVICSCGEINDENAKFCAACGKNLQSVCTNCGNNVKSDDAFCDQCGKKL